MGKLGTSAFHQEGRKVSIPVEESTVRNRWSPQLPLAMTVLEQSKYALRMILLLHASRLATWSWLLRHIPTSPETVLRCARILESSGLITSRRELGGRKRHLYSLTELGEAVASSPPADWVDFPLQKE